MILVFIIIVAFISCGNIPANSSSQEDKWTKAREAMVQQLRDQYQIKDENVLAAMTKVRRHVYIPENYLHYDAYGDHPCPIGNGQTISQPYIVAYMTEIMKIKKGEKVLEIGTGSGYQAAVLAEMGANVYSIEIIQELAKHASRILKAEGYDKVKVLAGDGYKGWPEYSPFDVVIITCAPEQVPKTLVEQLKDGGRMILPLGTGFQRLVILRKKEGKIEQEFDLPVRFVPMVHGKDKNRNETK